MPQRFLRPGITNSDAWNAVSFEAQSFYIRILTLVDDFGRYDARIPILHGYCFALRPEITPQRTAALRSELQRASLIDVYMVDGKEFLQITKWQERARTDKSKYPDPHDSAANRSEPQDSASSIAITSSPSPSPIDAGFPAGEWFEPAAPKQTLNGSKKREWNPTETQLRLGALFRRRPTTRWSDDEIKAYRSIDIQEEDLCVLEKFYSSKIPSDKDFRRRNLETLLNNYNGEVDKARNFKPHSIF